MRQLFSHSRPEDYWRRPRGSCHGVGVARSPTGPLLRVTVGSRNDAAGERLARNPLLRATRAALSPLSQGVMKS